MKDFGRSFVSLYHPPIWAIGRVVDIFMATQNVSVDEAKIWFASNQAKFQLTPAERPLPEGLPERTVEFFSIYDRVSIKGSWDVIDSNLLRDKLFAAESGPRPVIVARTLNYYMGLSPELDSDRLCTFAGGDVLCGPVNSAPSIWHLPLLFASLRAKRFLLE